MNTIVRNQHNVILGVATVHATVKELAKKPGYISVNDIQMAINTQLDHEYMPRKTVVRSLATILEHSNKLVRK